MCLAIDAAIYMANTITNKNKTDCEAYTVDYYKLHKLLYISQGIMLSMHNKKMFQEDITAHSCGAFVSSYCDNEYLGGLDPYYSKYGIKEITEEIESDMSQLLTPDRKKILEYVATRYGSIGRDELIFKTKGHTPYIEAYNTRNETVPKPKISNDSIKVFFRDNQTTLYPDI